jgi:intergrase/recombinase
MVREFKPENHRLFAQMISMLEPTSGKKIFEEIKNISDYFKRIGDIAKIEDEKNKLVEQILASKNDSTINSTESYNVLSMYNKYKKSFSEWMFANRTKRYATSTVNECSKLFNCGVKTILDIRKEIINNKSLPPRTNNAFRVFLNFVEEQGEISPILLNDLRVYIKGGVGEHIDKRVPSKEEILKSIETIKKDYSNDDLMLYYFLFESGCRFEELKKVILEFDSNKFVEGKDFSYYKLFWRRGKKNAFILFFRPETIKHIIDNLEIYQDNTYLERFKDWLQDNPDIESSKYVRKFTFTEMIHTSEIDITIANLFQGRTTKGDIGEKHYLEYERLLVKWYPKFLPFAKEIEGE